MHGEPQLFFDRSLPLLILSILSKNKEFWMWEVLIFFAISIQMRWNISANAGDDLQLSLCEADFSWNSDIKGKNWLNRPSCGQINKLALPGVLHVTYFICW